MILLTGVSGSGKSILLRLAMGLIKPDSGQIFIEGGEIENLNEPELLNIRGGLMGMVFQEDSLFTGLTVYENAAYRLEEHGWSDEEVQRAVSERRGEAARRTFGWHEATPRNRARVNRLAANNVV
jgi:phospholipid/cholesterol/gamma-HCH transport system ATP-binding protein